MKQEQQQKIIKTKKERSIQINKELLKVKNYDSWNENSVESQ